jgi:hydroxylamine reductase
VCGKDRDRIQSLQETLLYGLKGMAAYAHHARRLGMTTRSSAFIEEALFATMTNVNFDLDTCSSWHASRRQMNLRVMQMLDEATSRRFGEPSPATVTEGTKAGPGHPGHGPRPARPVEPARTDRRHRTSTSTPTARCCPRTCIPKLREHPNLAGHFGGAWQKQKVRVRAVHRSHRRDDQLRADPAPSYKDRLFTTRVTAVPGGTAAGDRRLLRGHRGRSSARRCPTTVVGIDRRLPPHGAARRARRRSSTRSRPGRSATSS